MDECTIACRGGTYRVSSSGLNSAMHRPPSVKPDEQPVTEPDTCGRPDCASKTTRNKRARCRRPVPTLLHSGSTARAGRSSVCIAVRRATGRRGAVGVSQRRAAAAGQAARGRGRRLAVGADQKPTTCAGQDPTSSRAVGVEAEGCAASTTIRCRFLIVARQEGLWSLWATRRVVHKSIGCARIDARQRAEIDARQRKWVACFSPADLVGFQAAVKPRCCRRRGRPLGWRRARLSPVTSWTRRLELCCSLVPYIAGDDLPARRVGQRRSTLNQSTSPCSDHDRPGTVRRSVVAGRLPVAANSG